MTASPVAAAKPVRLPPKVNLPPKVRLLAHRKVKPPRVPNTVNAVATVVIAVVSLAVVGGSYALARAERRRAYVLKRMREQNYIDDAQLDAALLEPLLPPKPTDAERGGESVVEAHYVGEMVRTLLVERFVSPSGSTSTTW